MGSQLKHHVVIKHTHTHTHTVKSVVAVLSGLQQIFQFSFEAAERTGCLGGGAPSFTISYTRHKFNNDLKFKDDVSTVSYSEDVTLV